ncbi:MATE family efflux transporter [Clostridiaceae bacterium]|nr:MATE family efflux transporter [Clostridiaceae bacterium]
MTTGKPVKALLKFSVPLFAGNVMQNLYNVFDTAVVGHILGKNALAAVGNSYVPMLIINSIILGLSSGILILLAQVYGSGETEKVQDCMGSIQTLVFLIGGGMACLFFLSARGIFMAMDIPAEAIGYATDYLRIIALGIPFLSVYNFYSAVIKAGGNARTPIQYLSVSCMMNIGLDYVFVAYFRLGIRGAAWATVLSQVTAAGLIVFHLYRNDKEALVIRPDFKYVLPIFRLGITGVVQNGASAVSMFFIQGAINRFGVNEISAYTSAYKVETILTIPAVNLGTSLRVFTAQNTAAKNFERNRRGLRDSFKISAAIIAVAVVIIWTASPQLMYLLVGNEKEIIRIGVQYLHIISMTFPLCVSLYLLTNFLRGAGEIGYPLFNTLLELSFRTVFAFASVQYIGFSGIMLCRPLSFVISTASLSYRYFTQKWQER